MDYFVRQEYGDGYYLRPDAPADLSTRRRTIDKVVTDAFEQVVYSLNQPAAARGNQSVFWNIAYFDKPYPYGHTPPRHMPSSTICLCRSETRIEVFRLSPLACQNRM